MENSSSLFDDYYYKHNCGHPYQRNELWLNFFGGIARQIQTDIQPKSVLDAGCAMGFLVECLRDIGVEAYGIDISEYAISNAHESIQSYLSVGSITKPFPKKYDLIISIEVLEHLSKGDAEAAIANLCQFSDDILFSSTPFDYKEVTHFNVQPPDYWMEQFARHGFIRDMDFDATFITPWAVRLRKRSEPIHRIVREYDRKLWALNKENYDLRLLAQEKQNEIALSEKRISDLEYRWVDMQKSAAWRMVRTIQSLRLKLIPLNSRRAQILNKILH